MRVLAYSTIDIYYADSEYYGVEYCYLENRYDARQSVESVESYEEECLLCVF